MRDFVPAWVDGALSPVGKLEAHQRGLKHKAVSVFVMRGTETLIQRRALSKYHTPGLWANTCCTHPLWDESPVDCAMRRLKEELGITGLYPAHRDRIEYRADVGNGLIEHEVVDLFIAEATPNMVVDPNPEEVSEYAWMDLFDLSAETKRRPEKFTPWLRIYLAEHSERIFGALSPS
ncbi:isopentenyl-diphosphate Delta-isomerase [Dinoroseobacter sp. S76]|uniref:isopentenyl-diphosphate Delta-isomerase n=1 Tax=Dinoroseobacter sp. S76 TaxID=3415124 RepID=UPI003C7AF916